MVVVTSDNEWDPTVLDYAQTNKDNWYTNVKNLEQNPHANLFDEFGDYKGVHDPFSIDANNVVFHDALEYEPPDDMNLIIDRCCNQSLVDAYPSNVQAHTLQVLPD